MKMLFHFDKFMMTKQTSYFKYERELIKFSKIRSFYKGFEHRRSSQFTIDIEILRFSFVLLEVYLLTTFISLFIQSTTKSELTNYKQISYYPT